MAWHLEERGDHLVEKSACVHNRFLFQCEVGDVEEMGQPRSCAHLQRQRVKLTFCPQQFVSEKNLEELPKIELPIQFF